MPIAQSKEKTQSLLPLLLVAMAILSACASDSRPSPSDSKFDEVQLGSTSADVAKLLGEPAQGIAFRFESDEWEYRPSRETCTGPRRILFAKSMRVAKIVYNDFDGCAHDVADKLFDKVGSDMSASDVRKLLGRPESRERVGEFEVWHYPGSHQIHFDADQHVKRTERLADQR